MCDARHGFEPIMGEEDCFASRSLMYFNSCLSFICVHFLWHTTCGPENLKHRRKTETKSAPKKIFSGIGNGLNNFIFLTTWEQKNVHTVYVKQDWVGCLCMCACLYIVHFAFKKELTRWNVKPITSLLYLQCPKKWKICHCFGLENCQFVVTQIPANKNETLKSN